MRMGLVPAVIFHLVDGAMEEVYRSVLTPKEIFSFYEQSFSSVFAAAKNYRDAFGVGVVSLTITYKTMDQLEQDLETIRRLREEHRYEGFVIISGVPPSAKADEIVRRCPWIDDLTSKTGMADDASRLINLLNQALAGLNGDWGMLMNTISTMISTGHGNRKAVVQEIAELAKKQN